MYRIGFVLFWLVILSCNNKKSTTTDSGFSVEELSEHFRKISPPYQLSDTGLLKNKDTTLIRSAAFAAMIADSLHTRWFGKGSKVKYTPLVRMQPSATLSYYLIKAVSGSKKIALLMAFSNGEYGGVFPFLVPDADPSTSQLSMIDRSYSILKTVTQRRPNNLTAEGKEVFEYDADEKIFLLILTNPLNNTAEVINPIDTFSRKHKFAGDYVKDKKNFISVRDGRYPNQLLMFIHREQNDGTCIGELKGDLLLTSTTTAIYRQGGDPCVLTFRFTPSSITVKEDEGCGSHRGVDCAFDGTFARKKEIKPKKSAKKK